MRIAEELPVTDVLARVIENTPGEGDKDFRAFIGCLFAEATMSKPFAEDLEAWLECTCNSPIPAVKDVDAALRHYRPFWERRLEMAALAAPADGPSAMSC